MTARSALIRHFDSEAVHYTEMLPTGIPDRNMEHGRFDESMLMELHWHMQQ